ncbi:MAG: DUF6498-containing protein [Candidatus Micrarchaeota archaeon]
MVEWNLGWARRRAEGLEMGLDGPRDWIGNLNLDGSEKMLIFSNLVTIAMAVVFNYPLATLIWIYWLESVIIGFFAFFKILLAKRLKDESFKNNLAMALFFAFHYGFFHIGYFFFLAILPWFASGLRNPEYILLTGGVLFISHGFSFILHVLKQHEGKNEQTADILFTEPYARIIPMHLTIILSGFVIGFLGIIRNLLILVLFMGLKTGTDIYFHREKHRMAK